eukprot:TRINITY_DN1180_c0_g1_i1.p1 TRINITY_DN1180_c0_g1~~TRINITY_DN1180_c0_g1_i1.p1  ORF type:complete len:658 (+),score=191.60 TRINITY_DN1180_c0_g1_i1:91-2064(+)
MASFNAAVFVTVSLGYIFSSVAGSTISEAGHVSKEEVETSLMAELVEKLRPSEKSDRLKEMEANLEVMYSALPKESNGRLGHAAVRYALHRLLAQRYGWFIKGLEPDGNHRAGSHKGLKEWVPSYLQEVLEKRVGSRGFDLSELAVLAATLEDLVHGEAVQRLEGVYEVLGYAKFKEEGALDRDDAEDVIDTYLMVYLQAGNFSATSPDEAARKLSIFKRKYPGWREVESWARKVWSDIEGKATGAGRKQKRGSESAVDFDMATKVVEAIGTRFAQFNDLECSDLKQTLLDIEDKKQGRVSLKEFYTMGLHSHWEFTEKVDYLRTLGALDESDGSKPKVIVPNYLGSRPQCLEASNFYAVCCRNECEDLMGSIEKDIGESLATSERIAALVKTLATQTVQAPRELTETLMGRLRQVEAANGGRVPLHGRLFAQWMHHAFPRECPFPHEAGTTSPQTPDEWMRGTGQDSTQASEEEMTCHVSGPCGGAASESEESSSSSSFELPWLDAEELLVPQTAMYKNPYAAPSKANSTKMASASLDSASRLLRTVALAAAALGLAVVSRYLVPESGSDVATLKKLKACGGQRGAGWWLTLGLFLFPLSVISVDFLMAYDGSNELLICGLCWGVAALVIVQLRAWHAQSPSGATLPMTALDKCLV